MKLKHLVSAALPMGLLLGGSQAFAANELPDFCINDAAYSTTAAQDPCSLSGGTGFQADLFNGSYNELAVVYEVSPDGSAPKFLKFKATIVVDWGQILWENEAVEPVGLNNSYDLYAIVAAEGSITGANSFVADSATLNFFVDNDNNTEMGSDTLSVTGSGTSSVINWNGVYTGDDVLLASSSLLVSGSGTTSQAAGQDGFAVLFSKLDLTDAGGAFFTAPRPFYLTIYSDGDINDGNVGVVEPGQLMIAGDVSANMPEPGTLALLGLGLFGAGFARRQASRRA